MAEDSAYQWQQTSGSSSLMVHGGTGLIQTPSARMLPAGDLRASYTDNEEYRFWSVTLQLYPWMQSTVRYTDVRTKLYNSDEGFSGDQTLKDKGIDVKFRLHKESYLLPELSVGFRDFGGTGFFESEFIGLSKQAGPFDIHVNMGWGYLGSRGNVSNPFCTVADSFCQRPRGYSGQGGKIDYNRFFKGPAAIFGGIEYQTPWQPLRFMLEYEGNHYQNDRAGKLEQDSRWNVGAAYQWGNVDFSLNYQRGNTIGFGVTYNFNMHSLKQTQFDKPPRTLTNKKNDFAINSIDRKQLTEDLRYLAGFNVSASHLTENSMTIYGKQSVYRHEDEAIERVGRILASELPETVNTYRIVSTKGAVPIIEVEIDAKKFKEQAKYQTLEADLPLSYKRQDLSQDSVDNYNPKKKGGMSTGLEIFYTQSIGNPETFYFYQGGVMANAGYSFDGKTSISGAIKVTLFDNFDEFNFTRDSQDTPLHRVRTDVRKYVSDNTVNMANLFVHSHDQLLPNFYGQIYGGYLETMYAGIGGELLYRPVNSNLAIGIDLNYVQQRSWDNDFELFDYTAVTGHTNVYWQPNFLPDTLLTLNIGQYLAKDRGVTIDFAKRFDSGIVVGAYAAITNVSSEDYGEGSFTKGFYISIPLDLFSLKPAKGRGEIPWVPIARDGGQALIRPVKLYNTTEDRSPFYR